MSMMLKPPARPRGAEEETPPATPRGVAVAVVFDWALAALAPAALILTLARGEADGTLVAANGTLVAAFALGEALRRGNSRARALQIGLSALALLINAAGLIRDLAMLVQGEIPRSISLPALLADLYILWGLTRPRTIH